MDSHTFDQLARRHHGLASRRRTLQTLGAAIAALGGGSLLEHRSAGAVDLEEARRKKKRKKRCRKLGQRCGKKKKCCRGRACVGGRCTCPPGQQLVNGACVPVPPQPECSVDTDCADNETCANGTCTCDLRVNGTCVRECENGADCPGPASCRNHFPSTNPFFDNGVCVDEPFDLCGTNSCNGTGDAACGTGEICVLMGCGAIGQVTHRCIPIAVGEDFEN